jgi:release factor glutamine methyltransferase
VVRRVVVAAPGWLRTGGHVLVEAGERQVAELTSVMAGVGLEPRVVRSAELDATIVVGAA